MRLGKKYYFRYGIEFVDVLTVILCWALFYDRYNISGEWFVRSEVSIDPFFWKSIALIMVLWLVVARCAGFYVSRRGESLISEWFDIFKVTLYVIVITAVVGVYFKWYEGDLRYLALVYCSTCLALILQRLLIRGFLGYLRRLGYNLRRVAIVGAGEFGRDVARRINEHPSMGFKFIGYFEDNAEVKKIIPGSEVLGGIDEVEDGLKRYDVNKLIIALPFSSYTVCERVLSECMPHFVDISIVPDIFQYQLINQSIQDLGGIPMINLVRSPQEGISGLIKRSFDVLLALIFLSASLPILLLAAVMIKIDSRGPLLFKQERVGLNGKNFYLLKFRSMYVHNPEIANNEQAKKRDSRITRVGRVLRKMSIDELPQFINVLKGDMSVVGPRPYLQSLSDEYSGSHTFFYKRNMVKPGITGLAQIKAWRGEVTNEKQIHDRTEYDIEYICNWSLWLDIRIVLNTIFKGGFLARRT
jgi:putative colanic acid biosysnthesis UDP-glucose lipid carrier transferase